MSRLIIVGNGFDIHNGLKTRYSDFKTYLSEANNDLYDQLKFYYSTTWLEQENNQNFIEFYKSVAIREPLRKQVLSQNPCLWSDLETEISNISYPAISEYYWISSTPIENCGPIIKQFEDMLSAISIELSNWISLVNESPFLTNYSIFASTFIDNPTFINFNYTQTLEQAYGVDGRNILYIHKQDDKKLIWGTSREAIEGFYSIHAHRSPDFDKEIKRVISKYIKPTDNIINTKLLPFLKDKSIDEIVVLGLSFSDIDLPYLTTIKEMYPSATWKCSYYSDDDIRRVTSFFQFTDITYSISDINSLLDKITTHSLF